MHGHCNIVDVVPCAVLAVAIRVFFFLNCGLLGAMLAGGGGVQKCGWSTSVGIHEQSRFRLLVYHLALRCSRLLASLTLSSRLPCGKLGCLRLIGTEFWVWGGVVNGRMVYSYS